MIRTLCALALLAAVPLGAQLAPGGGHARPDVAAMRQQEAADMALLLGLNTQQRPLLDAMLPPDRPMERGPRPQPDTMSEGFDQQLQHQEADMMRRAGEQREHLAAARRFYAALDPQQKARFDALMRLRHGHHGRMGPRGRGGAEGGPDGPGPEGPPPPGL